MSHPVNTSRLLFLVLLLARPSFGQTPTPAPVKGVVVYQTDFGVKDGAVSEMKGVACGGDPNLKLYDLTHEIPAFNIWEASYRLWQTAPYWPAGTVFVSVVDPGVGTNRKSVVAHTKSGQYIVTPDNGTLTLIAEKVGIDAVREIDETKNRRAGSEASYTFHGRDVYSYTGARLAAGVIGYEGVGPEMDPAKIVTIAYPHAKFLRRLDTGEVTWTGSIPVLDPQYGNVWTNIGQGLFNTMGKEPAPKPGDRFEVWIEHLSMAEVAARAQNQGQEPDWSKPPVSVVFHGVMPYANSFGEVPVGAPLLYLNSLLQVSFALNQGDFAAVNHVGSGPEWSVTVRRAPSDAK